jgi:hypothetical protein
MANGNVQFTGTFTYGAPGSTAVSETVAKSVAFNDSAVGVLDVAQGTTSATVFTIPVGSISTILALYVENLTGQDMLIKFNSTTVTMYVPTGSALFYFAPVAPGTDPWTALSLTTTTSQVADGKINYRVFGN